MESEAENNEESCVVGEEKNYQKLRDVSKKINLQSHVTSENSHCRKLKYLDNISFISQKYVYKKIQLESVDKQYINLCDVNHHS